MIRCTAIGFLDHCSEFSCGERVEIDTAGDGFTDSVSAIPISGTTLALIYTRGWQDCRVATLQPNACRVSGQSDAVGHADHFENLHAEVGAHLQTHTDTEKTKGRITTRTLTASTLLM